MGSFGMRVRQEERAPTKFTTTAKAFGSTFDVLMSDLSTGGCMLEIVGGAPKVGTTLLLTLSSGAEASGEVVWSEGDACGIEFHRRIAETEIDRIAEG